jgi:hypothetical protein
VDLTAYCCDQNRFFLMFLGLFKTAIFNDVNDGKGDLIPQIITILEIKLGV